MPLKHYELQERYFQGAKISRLLSLDRETFGIEYEPYTWFMESLVLQGHGVNNLKNYAYRLANFLDFLYEGQIQCKGITPNILKNLVLGYHSYLVFGKTSQDALIKSIATARPITCVSPQTSTGYHAPVRTFIEECDEYHSRLLDQKEAGLIDGSDLTHETLFHTGSKKSELPLRQRIAINKYSVIAAVVCNGARFAHKNAFNHLPSLSSPDNDYANDKHFPLDKIPRVIGAATSHRNSALWSLIAATGLRPKEAIQILWQDIDLDRLEVVAVNPDLRGKMSDAYKGLTEAEVRRLTWKGRKTKYTLMLEPYGSLFFDNIRKYIAEEYVLHGKHNFVFQSEHGRPLFLSDYGSVVLAPFQKAQLRSNIFNNLKNKSPFPLNNFSLKTSPYGLHSLRHSFCFFLRNYAANIDGTMGLTVTQIMMLTGHTQIKSVEKYVQEDREKLMVILNHANQEIMSSGVKSTYEYQLAHLNREILKVLRKIDLDIN